MSRTLKTGCGSIIYVHYSSKMYFYPYYKKIVKILQYILYNCKNFTNYMTWRDEKTLKECKSVII